MDKDDFFDQELEIMEKERYLREVAEKFITETMNGYRILVEKNLPRGEKTSVTIDFIL